MLQRAASNAYSWWWASHIRTKQSKWLEQNLQDMEEKVQIVLRLIEEDGDSFAKRAEMYYKKRPELISFVEESYRAYRALAERYDHISTELQNANNTIASVFPEQVQFAIDAEEEEEDASKGVLKKALEVSKTNTNVPAAPKGPIKELKRVGSIESPRKSLSRKKTMKRMTSTKTVVKSGLEKPEAVEEIDKLQKQILSLQTEKEFVKSSYENGVAKYWEIENQIKEKQERVSRLQDEFGEGMVIEDNEARNLMAEAALKSCQETLARLQQKQESTIEEATLESQRIKDVREKLESLKNDIRSNLADEETSFARNELDKAEDVLKSLDEDAAIRTKEREKLESLRDKIKDQFDSKSKSNSSFTVTEMVEKIDELVNKVISLETAVSSQAALVERLKTETDELQAQIRSLEGDKAVLLDGKKMLSNKLKEMEEKFDEILVLDKSFKDKNNNLKMHFTEANCNLDHLSDKLQCVKPDEEELAVPVSQEMGLDLAGEADLVTRLKAQQDIVNPFVNFPSTRNPFEDFDEVQAVDSEPTNDLGTSGLDQQQVLSQPEEDQKPVDVEDKQALSDLIDSGAKEEATRETEDETDWQKLFENGMDSREKTLLSEYTLTLRNYRDVKKRLGEAEQKNQEGLFKTSLQLKDMKSANAKKDEEIKSLRLKLGLLEDSLNTVENEKNAPRQEQEEEEDYGDETIKTLLNDQEPTMSATEEKFRMDIDELLEENLDFWLRFSSSFHQIQKFDTEVEDLKSEIKSLQEKRNNNNDSLNSQFKSDARPLYKHLMEIQTELTLWLEKSAFLKEELQCRFSSLCDIQEEIIKGLKASAEDDDFKFTSYQAAKFQGEVLNMKQENNKVADELQAGLDHVTSMQIDVERTLLRLNEEFELAGSTKKKNKEGDHDDPSQLRHTSSRSRIPLRSFIFGVRSKKQKASIFACVTPSMHRKYQGLKAGPPF